MFIGYWVTGGETITVVAGVNEHMAGQSNKACLSKKMREKQKRSEKNYFMLLSRGVNWDPSKVCRNVLA